MSTTREEMRRELKELTKLAETMRKEAAPDSRPPYAHLLEPENNLAPPTPDRPLSVSSVTVPPVVQPSVPPPATDVDDFPPLRRGRKGLMAVAVGGALVVALVGGAAVGRSVTSHRAAANAAIPVSTGPVQGPLVVDPPQDPLPAQAPPAQAPADPPAPPVVAAVAAAANPAPATPPAATPAAHRRAGGGAPHRAAKLAAAPKSAAGDAPAAAAENDAPAPAPAKATPVAKAAVVPLAAPAAAPAGGSNDSLEDMIRKAVASTPAKK